MALMAAVAALLGLGMAAQWIAWRLRLPSILLLLAAGFAAGPEGLGWIRPDWLLGDHLLPIVSLCVGLILFEGGLSLKRSELQEVGTVVWRLVGVGALATWVLSALAAWWLLDIGLGLSVLLGAILVVSGPTVVLPLVRHIRPRGSTAAILKWEGIVIDPIGAVLALLVYEGLELGTVKAAAPTAFVGIWNTLLAGTVLGVAGAELLAQMLKRYWLPDALQVPFTLAVVVAAFAGANAFHHEAGLLAVTLMGVLLANRKGVPIEHILEFKENLRVLLISCLFLLLAARVDLASVAGLGVGAYAFVLALVLVVRPLVVALCTRGTSLTRAERIFLAWMCPRGIVAASVASVFALGLAERGAGGAEVLVPVTFLVIVGTVAIYGLTAGPLARRLGLSSRDPQGVLLVGADPVARAIAGALAACGIDVLLADTNRHNLQKARMEGLRAWRGNVLSEHGQHDLDLAGIGNLLAATANDDINRLAVLRFRTEMGRRCVFRLAPASGAEEHEDGRVVFGPSPGTSHDALRRRLAAGERLTTTRLSAQFDLAAFRAQHGDDALVLFVVGPDGRLRVSAHDKALAPAADDQLVALVPAAAAEPVA